MNHSEIHALIQLLDDDDREVYKHVQARLKSYGTDVIPRLEEVWNTELNPVTHERLEEIIHEIQFDSLKDEWAAWLAKETPDLLTAAYLLAKYNYPELRFDEIQKQMVKLKQSIWLELNYNQTPLEQVQIFNQVFYSYHGFTAIQSFDDFQDFSLNNVLQSKKGNSIIIGIIYQILANELNLPVYGVNLSRHYVLAFCKRTILDFDGEENNGKDIMFYINPVNKGSIFSRNEIKDYLDKLQAPHDARYFNPSDNRGIIMEMISYLQELYTNKKQESRIIELAQLLSMF